MPTHNFHFQHRRLALYLMGAFAALAANAQAEIVNYDGTNIALLQAGSVGPVNLVFGTGSPSNNIVTVNYTPNALNDITGFIYGGYRPFDSTAVSNNTITLISGTVGMGVYGGYGDGNAIGNTVSISGGTFDGYTNGGFSINGNATGNMVSISGGTFSGFINGGVSFNFNGNGNASGNTVSISGGTFSGFINGGDAGNNGSASGNAVIISGGTVSASISGGDSNNGNASGNAVIISGGTGSSFVKGGSSNTGNATGNIVSMSSGTFNGFISGGAVGGFTSGGNNGNVTGNKVIISGGTFSGFISGGDSDNGNASGNVVIISDGTVSGSISGGGGATGSATGNAVIISGGTVTGSIKGGYSDSSNASDNTVTLSGNPNLSTADIVGGYSVWGGGDIWTGNTLNVRNSGLSANSVNNFQNYNFYLPTTLAAGGTMLTTASPTDLTNSVIGVRLNGSSTALHVGDRVTLLQTTGLTAPGINTVSVSRGVGTIATFNLDTDANNLYATLAQLGANPQTKAFSEGRAGTAEFVSRGADMIGQGLNSLLSGADGGAFGATSGGSLRIETGSHINVNSYSLITGFGTQQNVSIGALALGGFFEAGQGSYNTDNSFTTMAAVKGSGNTRFTGIGALARLDMVNNLYLETSARAGRTSTSFNSNDIIDGVGNSAHYDLGANYTGVHLGIGRLLKINDTDQIDIYSKYFWTRLKGKSASILDDRYYFDAIDSQRLRAGLHYAYRSAETTTLYAGLAYEYEFDGKASATVNGMVIDAPSLVGGTGILEVGVRVRPNESKHISLDFNAQGFVGQRTGFIGNAQMKYTF